jgi:hypothetical protein
MQRYLIISWPSCQHLDSFLYMIAVVPVKTSIRLIRPVDLVYIILYHSWTKSDKSHVKSWIAHNDPGAAEP